MSIDPASRPFLESLLATVGPSGYEDEPAAVWRASAERWADRIVRDRHGNTDAVVNEGGAPRVLLAGHLDEIGFLVTHVESEGFLRIAAVGKQDPQVAQGQRALIRTAAGRVHGLVGRKAIHLQTGEEAGRVPAIDDLWIDIGAASREDALARVAIGDPVVLDAPLISLSDDRIACRGLDDRGGAFAVHEAGRLLAGMSPKAEVHVVATCQEEIGLRGARTSAYRIDPAVAIVVDVTFATDHPGSVASKSVYGDVTLGGGPVISRGPNINPHLFALLVETAQARGIPYQIMAEPAGTGTDAQEMQLVREGIATALVSIPMRYMHTPCELVSLTDLDRVARLLAHAVVAIDDGGAFIV